MNSLEMYQAVFQFTSVATGLISTDGKLIDINEKLRSILAYDDNELSEIYLKSLIHPDDIEEVMSNFNKLIDGSIPCIQGVKRFLNSKGEILWGELRSVPLYGNNNEITAIVSTIFEAVDQDNVDTLLRKHDDSFNWLFQIYNDNAVIVIDEDMTIIRANKRFSQVSGYPLEIIDEKRKFSGFIHTDDLEKVEKYHYLRRKKKEHVPGQYYCRIIYENGKTYKHLLRVTIIPGTQNSIVSLSDKVTSETHEGGGNKTDNVFRLLAENVTDQIFISDLDFNLNYISPSVERISGYTQEEFKLLTPEEYMTPVSHEKVIKFQEAELKGADDLSQIRKMELQVVHRNGSLIWVETLVKFILDNYGNPVGIIGSSRDITERKESEEALRLSEEKYRVLTEGLKDVVLVVSPDLIIEYISPSVSDFCDYLPEEVAGTHISNYFAVKEEFNRVSEHFCRSFKKKEPATACDFLVKVRNRESFYIEVTANPSFRDGKFVMAQCVARDISERKKVEKRLREDGETLSIENLTLKKSIIKSGRFGNIIGKSEVMLAVYELILKAVPSNANIIIYGDSGTGKELAAQAIHEMSDRSDKPFVVVNCGAIPENIIESEFFGYKKGAFTGAVKDKEGFLDLADGGTLFLDEIGEIGLNMQVKLLRAIEGGGYTPVGSHQIKKPRLHIVAATNRNLSEMVVQKKMREDFFFRIHVIPIQMPPLRKRKDDIPLLMDHFLAKYRQTNVADNIPPEVKRAFIDYHWPGNVRELQNALFRYLAINKIDFIDTGGDVSQPESIYEANGAGNSENSTLATMVETFEKHVIGQELDKNKWNKSKTAGILKIDRKTLSSKIKKYELQSSR